MTLPCETCVHYYKVVPFSKPVCRRFSNIELKTKKNKPFKIHEAYKICKGYFYEHKNSNDDEYVCRD